MRWRATFPLAVFVCVSLLICSAQAGGLDTVSWAPDSTVDGTGTGTLDVTNIVTYTTAVGFNAGTSGPETWINNLGNAAATGGSVTSSTRAVLGGTAAGTTQTITFTSPIVQPVLLVNFLGGPGSNSGDVFNFGTNAFTLLSSFNAMRSGNLISGTTPTDSANDGFGIQFSATFGPGTPLQFLYTTNGLGQNGLQTVGFTVGIPVAVIPEPTSVALLGIGLASVCLVAHGRSRRAARLRR
jgi:hypothetical protein